MENKRDSGGLDFGTLLRRYRRASGLSQEALAKRALVSADGIGALERGHRRVPQPETIARLASALALGEEERRAFAAAAGAPVGRRARGPIASDGWPAKSKANLPVALTSFVGREAELEEIEALLHSHRLVTLIGPGGVGKTQTALRVANRISDGLGAVLFVALAPIPDSALVVPGIASALGVQSVPGHRLLETVTAAIKNRGQLLLLLDNCEHVLAEVARIVYALLLNAPQLRVLATSREPLKTAGEYAYRLPPLGERDAIALFSSRARAVDFRFTMTDESEPIVSEICRRLDGIPLAIELAAARINVLPVKAIAAQLKDRFQILSMGERTSEPRQQTLRATIEWSCNLLSAAEKRMFDRLSVFAGSCTLEAVQAVCADADTPSGETLELLASLIDKSLVVADLSTPEPRYSILESFREYGRERLAAGNELPNLKCRHAAYYFGLHSRLSPVRTSAEEAFYARAIQEGSNLTAALHWAISEGGDVLSGQRAIGLLAHDKAIFGENGRVMVRAAAALAATLVDGQTPTDIQAMLAYAEAEIASWRYEYEVELERSRFAATLYRRIHDTYGFLKARHLTGNALLLLGKIDEAGHVLQDALAQARQQSDPILVGDILRTLSEVFGRRGDIAAARTCAEEAIAVLEGGGATLHAVFALENRAAVEFVAAKDPAAAKTIAVRYLEAARMKNHEGGTAGAQNVLAVFEIGLGQYDEATANAREALKYARKVSKNVMVAWSLQHLAAIAALRSRTATDDAVSPRTQAAMITGYVDAALTGLRAGLHYTQREQHGRTLTALREALGPELLEKLRAEGATMTEDEAVERALALMIA